MRGGALPPALLAAALGFALSYAPRGSLLVCVPAFLAVALAATFLPVQAGWEDAIFLGCWTSVVITAASVHLPGGLNRPIATLLAVNAGVWCGAVIAAAGAPVDLAKAAPWVLLALPGAWLVGRRWGIAIKVLASWLTAVAILGAALPTTTPTPGYVADHME